MHRSMMRKMTVIIVLLVNSKMTPDRALVNFAKKERMPNLRDCQFAVSVREDSINLLRVPVNVKSALPEDFRAVRQ